MHRRRFLTTVGACATHLAVVNAAAGLGTHRLFAARPRRPIVAREPWGRLERLSDGVWALVSTPLNDDPQASLTVANGGIVAGRSGVALIEGLVSPEGARWLAGQARRLTGRPPDHVILTHYHGDHANGLPGLREDGDAILHASQTTLDALREGAAESGRAAPTTGFAAERLALAPEGGLTRIDLGGRRLEIHSALGHTDSDLWIVLEDPRITWCGDLVWNGMVPNYVDAIPSHLSASVRALAREPSDAWVPGHGDVADAGDMDRYLAFLIAIEDAARRALAAGTPVEAAAAEFRPPAALGEWVAFSPAYYEVAFRAWERELGG